MAKFSASKVTRRSFRGFQEADYILELVELKVRKSTNQLDEIVMQFKIVDSERGYNNARVFAHLFFNDKSTKADGTTALDVAINRLMDMGVDVSGVEAQTLSGMAKKAAEAVPVKLRTVGHLFQDGDDYKARWFTPVS